MFKNQIDFVCVYIAEAHANDGWRLGNHVDIPDHKTFDERVSASDIIIEKYGFQVPIIYDTMENCFDNAFAVWPERYYLIKSGKVEHIFSPSVEFGFDRDEIGKVLFNIKTTTETH